MIVNGLTHKGYARIYVEHEDNIQLVKSIIREMDEFEYSYLPENLIAIHTEYPKVVYTHKFSDLNMNKLTAACWAKGIMIWVFDAGRNEFPEK